MACIRILNYSFLKEDLPERMRSLGVDPVGIGIMAAKADFMAVYVEGISGYAANILKQELLSLGGDFALPKSAIFKKKNVQGVILASRSHFNRLFGKLNIQPPSIRRIGAELKACLDRFSRRDFVWKIKGRQIDLSRPVIMGIVNASPDSFSGDGILCRGKIGREAVLQRIRPWINSEVGIIDVGGESTRPGAKSISARQEIKRVLPVISIIKKHFPKVPVSIDTYKPQVAKEALNAGCSIVNDITGLRDRRMAELIARQKAGVVIMHMKGRPLTMQKNPVYKDVVSEVYKFLEKQVDSAVKCGIDRRSIVIDPGIGFGKTLPHNLALIKSLHQFKSLGMPLLIGLSRKSFIGRITGRDNPQDRLAGTLAGLAVSIMQGCNILRVHDVEEAGDVLKTVCAIMEN